MVRLSQYNANILASMVRMRIVLKYQRTIFGHLWSLISPLANITILSVVFSSLFGIGLFEFTLYLFSGYVVWNIFSSTVSQCAVSFVENEGMIKHLTISKLMYPLTVAIVSLYDGIVLLAVLTVFAIYNDASFSWSLIYVPVVMAIFSLFSCGVGIIAAIANVFFRDFAHILGIGLQALFFLTPVIYRVDSLSKDLSFLMNFNPLVIYLEAFRGALIDSQFPSFINLCFMIMLSALSVSCALLLYRKFSEKIVYAL